MTTTNYILLAALSISALCLWSCKSNEITGEIHGIVTDAETSQPLADAFIILGTSGDSIVTSNDGTYLINKLQPGQYEIQAFKTGYMKKTNNISVSPEKTAEVNFALGGAINISEKYLDFGVESVTQKFTVSKTGKTVLKYTVTANQSWIEFSPASGELTNNTDTLKVTIKRTGSSIEILKGEIVINSTTDNETQQDKISVLVNGALDRDLTYYKVVKIGSQYWTVENANTGNIVAGGMEQNDPNTIKKYSYDAEYGGLYTWSGMMRGTAADNKAIGTTQGICPVGWHVPTLQEWNTLINYLGEPVSAVKLKEAGESHWKKGNVATNESGFTALPGGMWDGNAFGLKNSHGFYWTASNDGFGQHYALQIEYNAEKGFYKLYQGKEAASVRCIRNR
jgi:uncharacterized protein (TIGR02145 family)